MALASLAAQSWRELAVLIALSLVVILPLKWLGRAAGIEALAADTIYAEASAARSATASACTARCSQQSLWRPAE